MEEKRDEKTDYSISPTELEATESTSTYSLKEQRKIIKNWAKRNLVGKVINLPSPGWEVTLTSSGIKEAINQPHKHYYRKNETVRNIEKVLISSTFVETQTGKRGDGNILFHYFKITINGEDFFIVLKETKKEGKITFYSIVDKLKK